MQKNVNKCYKIYTLMLVLYIVLIVVLNEKKVRKKQNREKYIQLNIIVEILI